MQKISPLVKFSYNVSKGSHQSRKQLANKLNEKIFQALEPKIKNKKVSIVEFEQTFHSVMPENVSMVVKRQPWYKFFSMYNGSAEYIYDDAQNIIGQTIELSTSRNKIKTKNFPTALHEVRHVLDTLVHPKYTARTNAMNEYGLFTKDVTDLYNKELYKYEGSITDEKKAERLKELEEKILSAVKNESEIDKINCIQWMRYSLESEQNAYDDSLKYGIKLKEKGYKTESNDLEDLRKDLMLDEKIELLKKIGFDSIQKERETHRLYLQG